MGVVLSFEAERARRRPGVAAKPQPSAGQDDCCNVLDAVSPLLERMRSQYGFEVMRDGLPEKPEELALALAALLRALTHLDSELGPGRALATFGVYFGRDELAWFDDGFGEDTALALPHRFDPVEVARFIRPRLREAFP